jgi:hypothetical protein
VSTGPGRLQREILRALVALPTGYGVVVVPDTATRAQGASYRRSAHTLALAGRVRLERQSIDGRSRLVAWSVEGVFSFPGRDGPLA